MKILAAVGIIVGLLVVGGCSIVSWGVSSYNSLVISGQNVNEKLAQVQNVYQRRSDLIPNLVATTKGYAKHESGTLDAVISARARATQTTINLADVSPEMLSRFQQAQGELSGMLSRLMVVVERYPDLKANENFRNLMTQLEGTENRIAVERREYNIAARDYNTSLQVFPKSMIAKYFGFKEKPFFQAEAGAEKAPEVKF